MTGQTHKNKRAGLPKIIITVAIAALIFSAAMAAFVYGGKSAAIAHAATAQEYNTVNKNGFAGGSGSEKSPFLIATAKQLDNVRNYSIVYDEGLDSPLPGNYFKVVADIDLTDYLAPGGSGYVQEGWGDRGWEPIDIFESTFDGGGYTINGLWCDRSDENGVGLFGLATGSYIKNIRLVLSDKGITGLTKCGGIVGSMGAAFGNKQSAKISSCKVTGSVSAALSHTPDNVYYPSGYAGLIAGLAQHAQIEDCEASGRVTGLTYIGGIAGGVEYANVYNSIFSGEIISTAPSTWEIICAGGIAGTCFGDSLLKNCFYYGVLGLDGRIAGIAGCNGWLGAYFNSPPEIRPLSPPEVRGCYYNADVVKSSVTYMQPEENWTEDCGDETCDHTTCDGLEYLKYAVIENSRGLTAAEIKNKNRVVLCKTALFFGFFIKL